MSTMLETLTGNKEVEEYNDDKIHSVNIMGDMFTSMTQEVERNDLKSFKKYLCQLISNQIGTNPFALQYFY